MKKKILIIFTIILLVAAMGYIIFLKVNTSTVKEDNNTTDEIDNTSNVENTDNDNTASNSTVNETTDPLQVSYLCTTTSEWKEFDPKEAFGYYLGKYRSIITYRFVTYNSKYLESTNYQRRMEFENIDGYSYYDAAGDFDKVWDEENLTKTYTSTKYIVGSYSTNMTIVDYINDLTSLGYSCKVSNE